MLKAGLHSLDTSQVGDAVNTICILEMECLAQEPCVPVKGGEDKVSNKDVTVIFYIFFIAPRIVEPFFAEDQAGRVRVATAENKAAAAKVELEALQRVEASERIVWDGRKWQHLHLMVPKISPTRKPEDLQGQTVALSRHFKTREKPADFDMGCGTTWQPR